MSAGTRVEFFRPPQRPTGGTVYVRNSGNPYANVEDQQDQDIVTVELPEMEEEE